jgi:hypothetical protein
MRVKAECAFHRGRAAITFVSGEPLCVDCRAAAVCPVCGDIEVGRQADILGVCEATGFTILRQSCSILGCVGSWVVVDDTPRGLAWHRFLDDEDMRWLAFVIGTSSDPLRALPLIDEMHAIMERR